MLLFRDLRFWFTMTRDCWLFYLVFCLVVWVDLVLVVVVVPYLIADGLGCYVGLWFDFDCLWLVVCYLLY